MNPIEIKLTTYGQVFSSRQEGREAALATMAYHINKDPLTFVIIDFEGVLIMTPSWLSEFIQTLNQHGVKDIQYKNHSNKSVTSSIEMIEEEKKT